MNKKNRLVNVVLITIDLMVIYFLANTRWINRMPNLGEEYTIFEFIYDYFLGEKFLTVVIAFTTIILSFCINKFFIKQQIQTMKYIIMFLLILFLNMIVYSLSINTAF